MSHEIDMSNGRANVMVAGEAAWHKLGVRVDEAPTSDKAMELAGLDWMVEEWPMVAYDAEKGERIHAENTKALVRDDTKAILGIHSERYQPLQNKDAFRFMDALADSGEVTYETAGSLKGGKVIWMLAKLPTTIEVTEQDVTSPYVLLSNSHDGTQAIRVYPTAIRVVCNNTLRLADSTRGEGAGLNIMHLGRIDEKIAAARDALGLMRRQFEVYGDQARALAGKSMTKGAAREYFADLLPLDRGASERTAKGVERKRARLMELWAEEPANTLKGIEGTAWAAVNAVTQYADYDLRVTGQTDAAKADNRLRSMWFGQGHRLKVSAMDKALAMV
jgi:phage/plasmid-like protein (TIGR03299 family)